MAVLLLPLLAGCSDDSPSALSPAGPQADSVSRMWWVLFWIATVVCVIVITLAVLAPVFRRRAKKVHEGEATRFVVIFGIAIPALILAGTFGISVAGLAANDEPDSEPQMTVEVIGHQWWWEVRYPGTDAVTANEIHVPVDAPVRLRLRTADVIHSFWVPQLMPKTDLLPDRVNETWLQATEEGTFRGQCAEYCGLQHTHMALHVVAEPEAEFDSWLERQAAGAQEPTGELAAEGMDVFTGTSCATCHTVRGTSADGDVGPDLTHVGSRDRIGAGAVPNDVGHLSGWVSNSQTIKPGNQMPPQPLEPQELRAVVAYLQSLE